MFDYNIVVISLTVLLANASYGLSAPILPQLLKDKGVPESLIGSIWATFSIAVLIISLIAGKIVDVVGHSNMMSCATLLMAVTDASFGAVFQLEQNWAILALCIGLAFV